MILALYSLRNRELRLPFFACMLGAALAMLPMFCNSVVRDLASSGSAIHGLRNLIFQPGDSLVVIIQKALGWYVGRVLPVCFLRGVQTALPLSLLTVFALWSGPLRLLTPLGVLPLAFHFYMTGSVDFWGLETGLMWMLVSLLCWLLPLLALLVQRESWRIRWGRLLLYLSAPLSLLPLALTTTTGFRVSFFPVVMLIAAAADSALPLLRRPASAALSAAGLALLLLLWSGLLTRNLACTQLREQLIQEAIQTGQDTLYLPTGLSRYETCYPRNPWFDETADAFRRFYRLPEGITLVVLWGGSFEAWPDIPPEIWENRVAYLPYVDFEPLLPY